MVLLVFHDQSVQFVGPSVAVHMRQQPREPCRGGGISRGSARVPDFLGVVGADRGEPSRVASSRVVYESDLISGTGVS